jgi:multidrug transporter EmrE-like cation transporter
MSLIDITALSLSEIVGDFGFKAFATSGGIANFSQGMIGYVGVIYCLIKSFKVGNVIYVNGMWDGISTVLEAIAAYLILGDRLNNKMQWVGLGMLIVGIILVRMGGIAKST